MEGGSTCKGSSNMPSPQQFVEAEKLIMAGIIARLTKRYSIELNEISGRIAAAVAGRIFNIDLKTLENSPMSGKDNALMDSLIKALSEDREICGIVTQAFIMRIVNASKSGGCGTEDFYADIDRLKEMGLYIEDGPPPTAASFLKKADAFFMASAGLKG